MANIHDLIVKYDSTSPREGLFPINLNCSDPEVNKVISAGLYDLGFTPPKKVANFVGSNTKMLTKIEDCDGSYVLVENGLGEIQALVVMLCDVCSDANSGALGASCDKPMNTKDCDREALIEMLQTQLDELIKIYGAVDGLELTTENIRIEAGQINLNTDQVETLLTQINDLIALKGSDCANALFVKDCGTQDLLDKLQEVIDAINTTSADEQAILNSIDTKLDELILIKDELVKANTTLDGIKVDTALINTNLLEVIAKLDLQITALNDLKALVTDTNVKLDTANATLNTISTDIALIKADIATIKADVAEIKTDVKSILVKLDTIITSLTTIDGKLNDVIAGLETINTTLQTEFDQTQTKLDELKASIEFAQGVFQPVDCDGVAVGAEENVLKTIVLNNQLTTICNVQELADAINAGGKDYTGVLNSIDEKLDDLSLIRAELVTANSTLTDIKTNTDEANVKLGEMIAKLDAQIVLLTDLKAEAIAGNVKLEDIKTLLGTIDANIVTIKNDLALIKADIADIKIGVQSIDNKLDNVITSLTSIEEKLNTIHDDLVTINTTLQTEFDQTQAKLDELIAAVNDKGSDCTKKIFVSDCDKQEYLDALKAIEDAISGNTTNYTDVLNSIDTKLNDLSLIKAELISANTTLSDIKTNTAATNTKLDSVLVKLDSQITLLTDIKAEAVAGNVKLEDIKALLSTISDDVDVIKNDIAVIKGDVAAIKTSVASIDTKLTAVVDSLSAIEGKLDSVVTELQTINTTLQTEFDQTQAKLDDLIDAVNATKVGKVQDLLSWVASVGQTATIPAGKFSTMALMASKGEFTISNGSNNFVSDITFSGGTKSAFIEISEDGTGTATGATNTPNAIDTRTNANDMDLANNSFLITCVRAGVLSMELYKTL